MEGIQDKDYNFLGNDKSSKLINYSLKNNPNGNNFNFESDFEYSIMTLIAQNQTRFLRTCQKFEVGSNSCNHVNINSINFGTEWF